MPVVRELTGELSFKADTKGAKSFIDAVKQSKDSLIGLNNISLAQFIKNSKAAFALVGTIATLGGAAMVKKYADVETSLDSLKIATGEAFAPLKQEIQSILKDKTLKNLVTEIDLVTASLAAAQNEGATGESIARFLKQATTLGIAAKKPIGEILGNLVKGEVEAILKLIGQLPLELQELLKISQTDFNKIGLAGRRAELEKRLFAAQSELEKLINEQRQQGLLTFIELNTAFDKLTRTIGEGTLPAFKSLNDLLIPFIDFINRSIGSPEAQEKKRKEFIAGVEKQAEPGLKIIGAAEIALSNEFRKNLPDTISKIFTEGADNFIKAVSDFEFGKLNPFLYISTTPVRAGATLGASGGSTSNISNTFNITVKGGADNETGRIVAKEIKAMLGTISEQNKQATKIRGGQ